MVGLNKRLSHFITKSGCEHIYSDHRWVVLRLRELSRLIAPVLGRQCNAATTKG